MTLENRVGIKISDISELMIMNKRNNIHRAVREFLKVSISHLEIIPFIRVERFQDHFVTDEEIEITGWGNLTR